jgi:hypothetical protein
MIGSVAEFQALGLRRTNSGRKAQGDGGGSVKAKNPLQLQNSADFSDSVGISQGTVATVHDFL